MSDHFCDGCRHWEPTGKTAGLGKVLRRCGECTVETMPDNLGMPPWADRAIDEASRETFADEGRYCREWLPKR